MIKLRIHLHTRKEEHVEILKRRLVNAGFSNLLMEENAGASTILYYQIDEQSERAFLHKPVRVFRGV